jgi:hypothetical protein
MEVLPPPLPRSRSLFPFPDTIAPAMLVPWRYHQSLNIDLLAGAESALSGTVKETPHFIGGRRQGMGHEHTNADVNNQVMMGAVGGASQMGTRVLLESLEAVPSHANRTPRPVATGDEAGTRRLTPELQKLAGDELGTVKPQPSFKRVGSRIRRTPSQHMKRRTSIQDVTQSFSSSNHGLGLSRKPSAAGSPKRSFGGDYKSSE